MSKALVKTSGDGGNGVVPAVGSLIIPGVGQLINGEGDKALGVFVVSVVTGANGTQVKHVWKKDGAEIWTATLNVGSDKWTTSSRRMLTAAGSYEVDVVGADGSELGKVEFTVQ